jgi:hypothetical protein
MSTTDSGLRNQPFRARLGGPGGVLARARGGFGPALLAATFLAMVYWTWGTWPDVLIDFGRELYAPWRLGEGSVLYRDIAWWSTGPLPPYLNALWFGLFGASLRTLVLCNLTVTAVLVWVLHRILTHVGDRFSATVACFVFLTVFGFSQYIAVGNYNYVSPYSHGVTHGLAAAFSGILFLQIFLRSRRAVHIAGAGFALGLAFLTKTEVFAAAASALSVGVALTLWRERPAGRALRLFGVFLGSSCLPALTAFALLSLALPVRQALVGMLGSWPLLLEGRMASLSFFQKGLGAADPAANLEALAVWAAAEIGVLLPAAILAFALRGRRSHRPWIAAGVFAVMALAIAAGWREIRWLDAARPLPVFALAIGAAAAVLLARCTGDGQQRSRLIVTLCTSILALVLVGKIALNCRVYHYGFALAMPAALLFVTALCGWVPALAERRGGCPGVFRAAALCAVGAVVVGHVSRANTLFERKTHSVARAEDAFLADRRGVLVQELLDEIEARLEADATLAVVPEGVMINYLSRRVNPTPYTTFMPTDLIAFAEDRMLESFEADPPDYIAVVHKDTSEFGYRFFGRDYAQALYGWIETHYRPVWSIGAPPLRDRRFGIVLMVRADAGTGSAESP